MEVLITGGTGYLGSRLGLYLAAYSDIDVYLEARNPTKISIPDSKIRFNKTDWESSIELEKLCQGKDVVVHCAGMNAGDSATNPIEAYRFNTIATAKLLDACIKENVKRFIYISTAHVYSSSLHGNITEDSPTTNFHPYAASHRAAEDLVNFYSAKNKLEGTIVRLTNSFGSPVDKNINCWMLLINDLCRQAVSNNEMVLKSTGLQRRDFITLNDFSRGIHHIINLKNLSFNLFNIGGEWSPTVWEMAILIQRRFKMLFDEERLLRRVEPSGVESDGELNISIDRLKSTGFELESRREEEIDHLLHFCKKNFGM